MSCLCAISLNYGSFIFKTRQRWNYNICCTGIWFSARVDTREKQLGTWRALSLRGEGFGWNNGQVWVRPDRWPLHSRWPIRAFISEIWEEVEDGGPGVRHGDKLCPIQPLAALPPPSPSSDPIFILVLCLPPLTPSTFFLKPKYKPR